MLYLARRSIDHLKCRFPCAIDALLAGCFCRIACAIKVLVVHCNIVCACCDARVDIQVFLVVHLCNAPGLPRGLLQHHTPYRLRMSSRVRQYGTRGLPQDQEDNKNKSRYLEKDRHRQHQQHQLWIFIVGIIVI